MHVPKATGLSSTAERAFQALHSRIPSLDDPHVHCTPWHPLPGLPTKRSGASLLHSLPCCCPKPHASPSPAQPHSPHERGHWPGQVCQSFVVCITTSAPRTRGSDQDPTRNPGPAGPTRQAAHPSHACRVSSAAVRDRRGPACSPSGSQRAATPSLFPAQQIKPAAHDPLNTVCALGCTRCASPNGASQAGAAPAAATSAAAALCKPHDCWPRVHPGCAVSEGVRRQRLGRAIRCARGQVACEGPW
jgi:hypothetical protein